MIFMTVYLCLTIGEIVPLTCEWQLILREVWVSEFGWISKAWMCIIVWVCVSVFRNLQCVGSSSVDECVSACAYICMRVCVSECVQLSQVCVINQLSGQFICWVTSCNFPPDSSVFVRWELLWGFVTKHFTSPLRSLSSPPLHRRRFPRPPSFTLPLLPLVFLPSASSSSGSGVKKKKGGLYN